MPNVSHICICILTYKRPHLLRLLLSKLESVETDGLFSFAIVVVDNDRLETSRAAVLQYHAESKLKIEYFVEPEQNIALARNKAIENSTGDCLAFIDDDELPSKRWLVNMFLALKRFKADGVLGPVLPYYENEPADWIIKGKFFERPNHPTGYVLPWQNTRSGNVLFNRKVFQDRSARFLPEFGSGGEDRNFFKRMIDTGYKFVWCAEAPVFEAVTPKRCHRRFMLRRALLKGQLPQYSHPDYFKSLVAVPLYSLALPVMLAVGHHLFMKVMIKNCDHIGRLLAFAGINVIKEKYVIG